MNSAETLAIYPSLRGQRVFVTGGATGIGAAIVAAFAEQGAQVAFVDIAESESAALAQRIAVGPGRKAWKEDPARGGPSLVMGDIGRMRTTCCVSSPGWKWQRWPPRWAASCQDESHMTLPAPC